MSEKTVRILLIEYLYFISLFIYNILVFSWKLVKDIYIDTEVDVIVQKPKDENNDKGIYAD